MKTINHLSRFKGLQKSFSFSNSGGRTQILTSSQIRHEFENKLTTECLWTPDCKSWLAACKNLLTRNKFETNQCSTCIFFIDYSKEINNLVPRKFLFLKIVNRIRKPELLLLWLAIKNYWGQNNYSINLNFNYSSCV